MVHDITLKQNSTLKDCQVYVEKIVKEKGFDTETVPEVFMLFLEECGELAKAARKTQKIKSDTASENFQLQDEAADTLFMLLDICNYFHIDLEKALRSKGEKDKKRIWK
jgi:NTP pyrophosphatase (non-canonical NTP hydrolase)